MFMLPSCILSRAGPEKPCLNPPAPSGKAKYYWETDSELVLWRKGEKNPKQGSEKNLKPCAYKRSEPFRGVMTCLLHNEPTSYCSLARLNTQMYEIEGKPSLTRAKVSGRRRETWVIYPWAGWRCSNMHWRTELISVEKLPDDLWVGVKGQSNWEIARTLRNAFRGSVV